MIPVILQNLIIFSVNMLDAIMLSRFGQSEFTAVTLANQAWFIFTLFMFGLSAGSCILTSQYFGRKDKEGISAIMFIGFSFSIVFSVVFAVILFFMPELVLKIYTNEQHLITLGAEYLKIVAPSYIISSVTILYAAYLKSVEKATAPFVFTCVSLIMNAILNYILIFGAFSAPRLGIRGAAIATLVSRIAEIVVLTGYFVKREEYISLKINLQKIKFLVPDYIRYSGPVVLNEFLWGVGASFYYAIFGRMGEDVAAAFSVITSVEKLGMIACYGLTQAASVILGVELGRGQLESAEKYAKYYRRLSLIFGFLCTITVLSSTPLVIMAFSTLTPEAITIYKQFIWVIAVFFTMKSYTMLGICSVLRSGGDSTAALLIDIGLMLLVTNPLGWVLGVNLKLAPIIVYIVLISEEFFKFPIVIHRIGQKKWINNLTKEAGTA